MPNVYTVSWVNAYIRSMISQDFMLQSLYVKGEASNVIYHSSGHLYFTLKDERGAIPCMMYASKRDGLGFHLEAGAQIIVQGHVDVYEKSGKYQLYADEITLAGAGLLYERYERLKQELEEMGMFDEIYKQKIPAIVRRLGVVTAPTGAAVRDIISVAKRRNPGIEIILYPAIVQGDEAPQSIVSGIRALEQIGVDVMIVGRGGGSIEDLWAFNERIVADAIFACRTPLISAVGHETDTTIADYVADLRAPTPSAAAELAILDLTAFDEKLAAAAQRLSQRMDHKLAACRMQEKLFANRLLALSPQAKLREQRMQLARMEEKLEQLMDRKMVWERNRIALWAQKMDGVSPMKKLSAGYAFVQDARGERLRHIRQIKVGDEISLYAVGGSARAQIIEKIEDGQYGGKANEESGESRD